MVILSLSASQLLSVVFSILLSMKVMGRPLLTSQLERRRESKLVTRYLSGAVHGLRGKIEYEAHPEDNPNWPWVVEKLEETKRLRNFPQLVDVSLQDRQASSGRILRGPLAVKLDLLDHVVSKLAFQGHFHFISEAVHFMHEQQYIQNLPQDFDSHMESLLVQEKNNWASEYRKVVLDIYTDTHTDKELVRWELHRLLENNCDAYRNQRHPDLPPPTVDFLLSFSRAQCVSV
ncbi:hypothetical protein DFJ43DRAFT_1096561 [Lentinula guzmanii]|uniref:Uncharacterized protein n=1 Tax=Lentinula guzmanii TaxID=2804957 RepID=A0AA38J4C9_9AGAR|nr:hypothetical protein DFJ43DRAFT_1096561 [Lentinula guzmanii]